MSVAFRFCTIVCVCASLIVSASAAPKAEMPTPARPQYVIISFDGAHDLAQWQRSRNLAARTGASFTYFLSCVFLLTRETRNVYRAPGKSAGRSNVGFAQSKKEVGDRLAQIWLAHAEGHDIASHGCGHFDGKDWSRADWRSEFRSFAAILRDAYNINEIAGEPQGWKQFSENEIIGFRAPYLATGKALFTALAESGFTYDASGVSRGPNEPESGGGLIRFALPQIAEGPKERRVIAMDYNLFVRHSGGKEIDDTGSAFEDRAYGAFLAAFDEQYRGSRIPLQIGFHFTLMNGGAYWRALERFAGDVCTRADVKCVSYKEYLASQRPAQAAGAGLGG
ncbi:polysaccharide deacetylase family protein [Pseudaminobacter sp. NGMCC 1.201702]|uniref:polysaccharide deacetylase n=1 Tax=Pseudaminobacter sp. NGMCC 1.201702 TaxID=3391825 RepID=UPI0039EEC51B